MGKIRVYTSKNCSPCQEIKDALSGYTGEDVEVVEIETDDGFKKFKEEVLDNGAGEVPSAYKDGQKCSIYVDHEENQLIIDCASEHDPPVAAED